MKNAISPKLGLALLFCLLYSSIVFAFEIGQKSYTFNDPTRANRVIPVQIYYPANTPGQDMPVANEQFPLVIITHGFTVPAAAYSYLWEVLVPLGYIVVLPCTEEGFLPDQFALGLDIAFIQEAMQNENNNQTSLFNGKINDKSAFVGHSLGGGATLFAANNNLSPTTLITLAAADQQNPPIGNLSLDIPLLAIAGTADCFAPNHARTIYDDLAAEHKVFFDITNGCHCHFTNGDAPTCYNSENLARLVDNCNEPLSLLAQHTQILAVVVPWLNFWLKDGSCAALSATYNNAMSAGTTVENPTITKVKVYLEGAYDSTTGLMKTDLQNNNLLPNTQPFNTAPWNYNGTETLSNLPNLPNNITDWLLLEVRDANNQDIILERKAALLLNNGNVIDVNGTQGVVFNRLCQQEEYYMIVRSRNHLAVMSNNPVLLPNSSVYDFTNPNNVLGNETQLNLLAGSGLHGLLAGDINASGTLTVADFNVFILESSTVNTYVKSDLNFDGQVTVSDFNLYQSNASSIGVPQVRY